VLLSNLSATIIIDVFAATFPFVVCCLFFLVSFYFCFLRFYISVALFFAFVDFAILFFSFGPSLFPFL